MGVTRGDFMGLLEPTVIPGLDRALLQLFGILAAIGLAILAVTLSSIVGMVRAARRRRRGLQSRAAVLLALTAVMMSTGWLLYWVGDNIFHHTNPLDGLFVINLTLCVLPCSWLITAIRANSTV